MDPVSIQHAAAYVVVAWLIGAVLVMARSVQRGRRLADELAARHPQVYEALGRPRPGYLESVRRNRFSRFVARREFEKLDDPVLAAEFEAYQKAEARLVIGVIASLLVVAAFAFAVDRVTSGP